MRQTKEHYIVVVPKNDAAKQKLEYHGERWVLRGTVEDPKWRDKGVYMRLLSRDGKKLIMVRQTNDPDYDTRTL